MMARNRFPGLAKDAEAIKNQALSVNLAKECLMMPEFDKYRRRCESEKNALGKLILEYKNPNPVDYAFYIQGKIKEFTFMCLLLDNVESDAGVANEND